MARVTIGSAPCFPMPTCEGRPPEPSVVAQGAQDVHPRARAVEAVAHRVEEVGAVLQASSSGVGSGSQGQVQGGATLHLVGVLQDLDVVRDVDDAGQDEQYVRPACNAGVPVQQNSGEEH